MKNKKDINQWEEELIVLNHRLQKAERSLMYEPENLDSWEMIHKKFHLTLVSRSKSSFMNKFCELLYDQNMRYRYLIKKKKSYKKRKISPFPISAAASRATFSTIRFSHSVCG